jgi:hypothetical protein
MKSRVVLGVLALIGSLTLSATAAQAGHGGQPFPILSFFVCQGMNGQASGANVDVEISRLGLNPQNITLGNGALACVVAKLFQAGTSTEIIPNPTEANSDGLKCYTVSSRKGILGPISNTYNITDDLFPGGVDSGVLITKFQYVCAPALFNPAP